MLLSAVRAAIITRIESTSLPRKSGPGDKGKVLRSAREPDIVQDRTFMVRLLSMGRDETNTCDAHFGTYQVTEFFAPSPDVEDRIADDSEVLHDPLETLHRLEPDVLAVTVGDVFVEEDQGRIAARRDVRVIYRRDQM